MIFGIFLRALKKIGTFCGDILKSLIIHKEKTRKSLP